MCFKWLICLGIFLGAVTLNAAERVEHRWQELYPQIATDQLQLVRPWKKACPIDPLAFPEIAPFTRKLTDCRSQTEPCPLDTSIYPPIGGPCPIKTGEIFFPTPTWRRNLFETWVADTEELAREALKKSLSHFQNQMRLYCTQNEGEVYWSRFKYYSCDYDSGWRCRGRLWALCEVRDF